MYCRMYISACVAAFVAVCVAREGIHVTASHMCVAACVVACIAACVAACVAAYVAACVAGENRKACHRLSHLLFSCLSILCVT